MAEPGLVELCTPGHVHVRYIICTKFGFSVCNLFSVFHAISMETPRIGYIPRIQGAIINVIRHTLVWFMKKGVKLLATALAIGHSSNSWIWIPVCINIPVAVCNTTQCIHECLLF